MKWHKHFGVYGVVREEGKLLVVSKTRGPYIGRYDLPGGTLNADESIIDHLKCEFIEETGFEVKVIRLLGVQDFLIDEHYLDFDHIQHIAMLYEVQLVKKVSIVEKNILINDLKVEKNDSGGCLWVELESLSINNASPLIICALDLKTKNVDIGVHDVVTYSNWKRIGE